ncbi:MAG: hypothetical protein QOG87_411 [Actinomycetota bacterium]
MPLLPLAAAFAVVLSRARSASKAEEEKRSRLDRAVQTLLTRYPVTTLWSIEYSVLVIWPGIFNDTLTPLARSVIAIGILPAFFLERVFHPLPVKTLVTRRLPTPAGALLISGLGFAALLSAAVAGRGNFSAIGGGPVGSVAVLLTPFQPWAIAGTALYLYLAWRGYVSRTQARSVLAIAILTTFVYGLYQGYLAPPMAASLGLAVGALRSGVLRPRHLFVGALVIVAIWPPLYQARNERRLQLGAYRQELDLHKPSDRLRLDRLMELMGRLNDEPPIRTVTTGPVDVLRFGLLPRAIDSNRPELTTANQLSAAVGLGANSAMTFTVLGNAYVVSGWLGLVVYSAGATVLMLFVMRRSGPLAFMVSVQATTALLWIESTYPDNVAGLIQILVAGVIGLAIARRIGRLKTTEPAHDELAYS